MNSQFTLVEKIWLRLKSRHASTWQNASHHDPEQIIGIIFVYNWLNSAGKKFKAFSENIFHWWRHGYVNYVLSLAGCVQIPKGHFWIFQQQFRAPPKSFSSSSLLDHEIRHVGAIMFHRNLEGHPCPTVFLLWLLLCFFTQFSFKMFLSHFANLPQKLFCNLTFFTFLASRWPSWKSASAILEPTVVGRIVKFYGGCVWWSYITYYTCFWFDLLFKVTEVKVR
jgi:hypothetical protein